MKTKLPPVPQDLLESLEKLFPDRIPDHFIPLENLRFVQGQISVVRLLRAQFAAQSKNILEN